MTWRALHWRYPLEPGSRQFFPRRLQPVVTILGVLQLGIFAVLVFTVSDFLVVILSGR